jgi:hypothetical protein
LEEKESGTFLITRSSEEIEGPISLIGQEPVFAPEAKRGRIEHG